MARNRKKIKARNRKIQAEYNTKRAKKKQTADSLYKALADKWFLEVDTIKTIIYGNWD